jgi:hypothetical protein
VATAAGGVAAVWRMKRRRTLLRLLRADPEPGEEKGEESYIGERDEHELTIDSPAGGRPPHSLDYIGTPPSVRAPKSPASRRRVVPLVEEEERGEEEGEQATRLAPKSIF